MRELKVVGVPVGELLGVEGHGMNACDDGIGEESAGEGLSFGIGDAEDVVAIAGGDGGSDTSQGEDRI